MSNKFKVIVLIPMLQRQFLKWRCVGEFQICKMPVKNLTVFRAQVHITWGKRSD